MTRRFRAFSASVAASACVLLFHSASFAQQAQPSATPATPAAKDAAPANPEPAKAEPAKTEPAADATKQAPAEPLPPEYGPPPGYHNQAGPPQPPSYPPGYYYDPYYYGQGYPPPPPPRYYHPYRRYPPAPRYYNEPITYRPFFFGFGLGVGGVGIWLHDTGTTGDQSSNPSRMGVGYNLRFGFGVSPRWSIVLSADGAQAYFNGGVSVSETAWTIGPQVFITRQLYARAGIGAATYSEDTCDAYGYCYGTDGTDSGFAGTGAIGFEFLQGYHTSLALEAVGTMARFSNKDKVGTFGVNFVLNLF